ncbi:hypothetical protein CYQ88_01010 [Hydrogenovibrio sp. SC-1]|nr:hypothetical protein CYQ88_01010 [Hydrogenovibrio sp. SC-1]
MWFAVVIGFGVATLPAKSALVACEAVADQAVGYVPQGELLATQQSLSELALNWDGELVGEIGNWQLYRTQQFALDRDACLPQRLAIQTAKGESQPILFYPVLKNQRQNRWAIFTGQFLGVASTKLDDFSEKGWHLRASGSTQSLGSYRYTFQYDALDAQSNAYDKAVGFLQRHPKIVQFTPVFIEQRYHLR